MKIDRASAEHYIWKDVCDGWHFVKNENLSIIAEKMPPNTAEDMHCHEKSRQFFYILSGTAHMILDDEIVCLSSGEGIEIPPLTHHQMKNDSDGFVEFFVVSMPKSHGDRIMVAK